MRILLVEDHEDTRQILARLLTHWGYNVFAAENLQAGLDQLDRQPIDAIVSDIGLPDRSGYELMQELSTTKGLRGIALSGFGMENDVNRARAAGFSEHLTKPINFDRLEQSIQSLLDPEPAVGS